MTDVSKDNFFLHNQTDMHARTHTHTHTPGPSLGLYQAAPLSSTEAIINNYQYWIFLSHENEMFTSSINYMKMKVFHFSIVQFCGKVWFMSNIISAANVASFSHLRELRFKFL